MLVLGRKVGESVRLGDQITLTIVEIKHNRIRLAIDAPPEVRVLRQELLDRAADLSLHQNEHGTRPFLSEELNHADPSSRPTPQRRSYAVGAY